MLPSIKSDHFYVYSHSLNGLPFYIGMGHSKRAFEFADPSRGTLWREFTKRNPTFTVTILREFATRQAALAHEKEQIKLNRPQCNVHGVRRAARYTERGPASVMTPSEMGKKGAAVTNAKLSKKQRSANARKAARARWANKRKRDRAS
jgi:hypothetical protein